MLLTSKETYIASISYNSHRKGKKGRKKEWQIFGKKVRLKAWKNSVCQRKKFHWNYWLSNLILTSKATYMAFISYNSHRKGKQGRRKEWQIFGKKVRLKAWKNSVCQRENFHWNYWLSSLLLTSKETYMAFISYNSHRKGKQGRRKEWQIFDKKVRLKAWKNSLCQRENFHWNYWLSSLLLTSKETYIASISYNSHRKCKKGRKKE